MSRLRASAPPEPASPELMLRKASLARTSFTRAKYAQRGLSHRGTLDRTTRTMLLRQLYLSHMEGRRFVDALRVAEQMLEGAVMPDVARQDAARACLGLGDRDRATYHLRIASRVSPPARRAFHLWTLGSVLFLNGQHREAAGALARAARWGTTDKPLYRAQLALARRAAGEAVSGLSAVRERLEEAPCGQGYGRFVLGALAYELRDDAAAERYLAAFVQRATGGRVALEVALAGEVAHARRLLRRVRSRRRKSGPSRA
ncbi:MAG TPA: tetratricopeptide repeat protein [Polyangiaceae bacterium]|nr:tetratricopeptide repeat protein [Polyangiaceae bacterium]